MSEPGAREPFWGALAGTLLFVAVLPATVIGWIPWRLTGWRVAPPLLGVGATRWLGAVLIVAGAPVFLDFLARFVREGRGTPAPIAPPRHLVVRGVFRWVRNPGYVGALALVAGQALLFGSLPTLAWAACLLAAFHVFVVAYEEPDLRRRFGAEYDAYCAEVPRWLPRLRPARTR